MRKMKGFYVSSAGLFVIAIGCLWAGANPTEVFQAYSVMQTVTAAGFFTGNFGEHYARMKAANGSDKQG